MNILVVVTPNFNLAATVGFLDPFRAANYLGGAAHFAWRLVSIAGGQCVASNAMSCTTSSLAEARESRWDVVIVSASWAPERHSSKALTNALRRWGRQGSVLGALDTGAFVLAEAGLLRRRRATVHYEHLNALRELYPDTEVVEDLFVFDGDRISCCGGSASVDFSLQIVERALGAAVANDAARYVHHQSLRPAGTPQTPGPAESLGCAAPFAVRQAVKVMEEHVEDVLSIPDIRSRGLVTQTDMPLSGVAVATGFVSQVHFSRVYKARFGLPPKRDRVEGRIPFEYRARPLHERRR